ncbi:MAG: Ppx/GppA phosphatase family protein, partial [Opitutales bacterium]
MSSPAVAVLDIGSNSIKVLVAARAPTGGLDTLFSESLDVRISAGISAAQPRLSEDGMARGLAAIQKLLALAAPYSPTRAVMVATSAVRDAANGPDFRARVSAATGFEIRILTGPEEAQAIGRGLTSDPALTDLQDFYVFDLGGGSLECLAFRDRKMEQVQSLQLGCVRLTEGFVADPAAPLPAETRHRIQEHVRQTLASAGFRFDLKYAAAVATGGTVT